MSDLTALLFDVDGTLADTERDGHRVAFNAAFAEAGLDWTWSVELYGELLAVTGGKERIRYYLDRYNTAFKRPAALDEFIADLHRAKTRHFTTMIKDGKLPLRPGVSRLLEEAHAEGVTLAIATTTTPENVEALLEHSLRRGALSWFELVAAGDVVPAKKPAPDIYRYALDNLKLAPAQCLAFEDSENGLKSSQGADLETVVTVNGYTRDQDFEGALVVLDHLGEPGRPCSVIHGELWEAGFVNMALLRRMHAAAVARAA